MVKRGLLSSGTKSLKKKMTNQRAPNRKKELGGVLECGGCRVSLSWNPLDEVYYCPECGWKKDGNF